MAEAARPIPAWSDEDLERSLPVRFESQVDRSPFRLALRTPHESLTYADLDRWANRVAQSALRLRGDRLEPAALLLGKGPVAIAGILGAFKAGKIGLFLESSLPRERIRFLLEDSGAGSIVSSGADLPLARSLAAETGLPLVDAEGNSGASEERPGLCAPPDTPAYIIYTSGSTGQPKGVVNSHRNLLWSFRRSTVINQVTESDRVLLVASPGAGQGLGMFQALLNGACVYPFDIESAGLPALRDWITTQEITVYHSVPAVFRSLVKTLRDGEILPSLRLVRLGGDTIRREDVRLFQAHFKDPCLLRVNYACTEACSIASHFVGASTPDENGPVPAGHLLEGVQVRIVDEGGQEVPLGEVGEILVRSKYLALGYWRRDDLTRERYLSDPTGGPERTCRTGDLGRFRNDGLLVHVGRKDFQVKIRGNRVEVEEVEAALRALPGVEDAVVAAHPGPGGDNRLVGYLVWRGQPVSTRELRAELAGTLPDHMVPAAFVTLPSLPLTPRGKVDRAALRPPDPETPAQVERGAFVGPRDDIERGLSAIWERLLGTRRTDIRSDFFELGGDSLLAVELFAEIERRMGKYLPLSSFLNASTIELLAVKLREHSPVRWASLVPIQPKGSKPPFYLVSWAEGEVLSYAPLAARLGFDRPVYGLRRERLGDGRPRHTRVEDIAGQYIEEVRAFQPHGPYHLGGLSAGGGIAFEMAHQLVAAGQEVGALVLMEPSVPSGQDGGPNVSLNGLPLGRVRLLAEKASWYWTKWRLFENAERVAAARRKAVKLLRGLRKVETVFRPTSDPRTGTSPAASDLLSRTEQIHTNRYTPRTYPGRAMLFLAAHKRLRDDPRQLWQTLVPAGLEIRVVPGFHESIIQEPFVRILGPLVEEHLSNEPGAG